MKTTHIVIAENRSEQQYAFLNTVTPLCDIEFCKIRFAVELIMPILKLIYCSRYIRKR